MKNYFLWYFCRDKNKFQKIENEQLNKRIVSNKLKDKNIPIINENEEEYNEDIQEGFMQDFSAQNEKFSSDFGPSPSYRESGISPSWHQF